MFDILGISVVEIGTYLMQIDESQFTNIEINKNIVKFMSILSIYLNGLINEKTPASGLDNSVAIAEENKYLSKKEIIDRYHPLLTEYGISKAIKRNELNFSKVGNKTFFQVKDVEKWLETKKVKKEVSYTSAKLV